MGHGDLAKIWDDASMAHVTALERRQLAASFSHRKVIDFDEWEAGAAAAAAEDAMGDAEGDESLFHLAITMAIQHYNLYFQENQDDDMSYVRDFEDDDVHIDNNYKTSVKDSSLPEEFQDQFQGPFQDQFQDPFYDQDVDTMSQSYTDHQHPDQSFDGWKYEEEKDVRDDVSNDALLAQLEQEKEEMELRKRQQRHRLSGERGSLNDDELVARLVAEEYEELYRLEETQCNEDQALTPQQMAVRMVQRNLEAIQLSQTGR